MTFISFLFVNNLVSMLGEEGLVLLSERMFVVIGFIMVKVLIVSGLKSMVVG